MTKRTEEALGFLASLTACYGVAVVGGLVTAGAVRNWYPDLAKPPWNPPAWVFGPVWTILYGMMAAAAWLVWRQRHGGAAIILFAVQLAFNAAWSPLFFGLRRLDLAFADIVLFWLALAATVWLFFRRQAMAGMLIVPYLLWVSFAVALNVSVWRLNA